jgi:hypothetical protein
MYLFLARHKVDEDSFFGEKRKMAEVDGSPINGKRFVNKACVAVNKRACRL